MLELLDPPAGDGQRRRTLSLVSAPFESTLMVATRMRDTAFKRALNVLPDGATMKLAGPIGRFTLADATRPAVLIAGGIGITPFMSMLRRAAQDRSPQPLSLLYSNRRPEDAAFLGELQELERKNSNFRLLATTTDMSKSSRKWDGWTGVAGDAARSGGRRGQHRHRGVLRLLSIPRERAAAELHPMPSNQEFHMRLEAIGPAAGLLLIALSILMQGNAQAQASRKALPENDRQIRAHAQRMLEEGRRIFRFDTFGSEGFWGDALQLHRAIAGEKNGGVGGGVSPKTALSVGLKVDAEALPAALVAQIKEGKVDLDDPATTLALLKLNAVVGVTGKFDKMGRMRSIGIQCAFCHSTVDNSFAPGIGKRLDGWANRDLNVGAIVSLAPNLKPFTDLLGVDVATVKKVLASWGPGRYDAVLDKDGKAFRPDGGQAGTLIPPAFGLAGVNLHTWTGFGSVPYWNAYVAATQMHGSGAFVDRRFDNKDQYPVSAKSGSGNTRGTPDTITAKLAALHFYQIAIPAPKPPAGSFDKAAAARGRDLFNKKAQCATCHVPPLFTEPGHNLHAPGEIGVDSFQADRAPTKMYRTAPLAGLWSHQKGGFYHDGRFATLRDVVEHYNGHFRLGLSDPEKGELIEYLKSL